MRLALLIPLLATTLSAPLLAADAPAPAAAEAKAKPYPLTTCIVTDEKLGDMGDPIVQVHEGQEVKFCCKGCIRKFKKDPAKYLKKLDPPAK